MFTSGGPENGKVAAYLSLFRDTGYPDGWRELLRSSPPRDDPSALVVRHRAEDGRVFATVFGQLVETQPGRLWLDHSREPWSDQPWRTLALG